MTLYMCQVLHIVDFLGVSPDGNCAYVNWGSFTSNSKSVRRAIWFTWFSEPHDSVYGTWQSQAITHPLMNRVRRCLTLVIEQISMSERRIPYIIRRISVSAHIALAISLYRSSCSLNCNVWQLCHVLLDRVRKNKRCSLFMRCGKIQHSLNE